MYMLKRERSVPVPKEYFSKKRSFHANQLIVEKNYELLERGNNDKQRLIRMLSRIKYCTRSLSILIIDLQ